ncbi:MAG: UvrD-helicase domain-containing protein [Anaerolineae bacterium]|nr:UvrD-helicase domain-containing protein [Anaerolineae bacterium]
MVFAFISYSRKNDDFADRLKTDLTDARIQVWQDRKNIRRGKNWDSSIEEILRSKRITHVLFVQSEDSVKSDIVISELSEAFENGIKYIIPLIIDDSKAPLIVKRRNPIDFRVDYAAAFEELLAELDAYTEDQPFDQYMSSDSSPVMRTPTPWQKRAARETASHIRLVAGPGTGKSFVIEERVRWLLERGVPPKSIFVVSFTRASSADLKKRIVKYCEAHNQFSVRSISVSTLHSLAFKALRRSGFLSKYATTPRVLDDWELENVFDEEFKAEYSSAFAKKNDRVVTNRASEIRLFYEALWSTGKKNPSEYEMPEIPVSDEEKLKFENFLRSFTTVYSCVLPGQIVPECVSRIRSGLLDPTAVLNIGHLIVDEYQDLNSSDVEFIDAVAGGSSPVNLYVLGDDDQSIYSFRFAYPLGIQTFHDRYSGAKTHVLQECFRCTPQILKEATGLILRNAMPQRLDKNIVSVHEDIQGVINRYRFTNEQCEARFIAHG